MSNRFSLWSFLAVLLALAGPLVVAVVGTRAAEGSWGLASHALSVAAIALTVVAVYAFSILVDGCGFRDLGFAQVSWSSIAIGFVLAGFFIGIFGPLASWSLAQLGVGGFEKGLSRVADLPTWSLILTIVVVASAEELLYRAYAIERLGTLIGSRSHSHRPVRARHRSPSGKVSGGRDGRDYDDSALNRRIGTSRPRFQPCDRSELSPYSLQLDSAV